MDKEPFSKQYKPTPKESSLSNKQEFSVVIELAIEKDWEEYKKIRLEAITGKDEEMFGETPEEIAQQQFMSDSEWKDYLLKDDRFVVLFWNNSELIGMARARKMHEEGVWSLTSVYVKPEFRGRGLGKKTYAVPLNYVKEKGGKKVEIGVNVKNSKSVRLAESFGFKHVMFVNSKGRDWNEMDLDLTDLSVIKKINEVLNAG